MIKMNFSSVDQFKGKMNYKHIPDPALYERSQFMKYFSSILYKKFRKYLKTKDVTRVSQNKYKDKNILDEFVKI